MARVAPAMRPCGAAFLASLVVALAGCAGGHAAQSDAPPRRSNVTPPSISLPADIELRPLASIKLTASTQGGEAMLFSIDWKVQEGDRGGRIEPGRRNADGAYEATYVAPRESGTFHVTATIREYPSASATTRVRVSPG